jgi:hypothetical protein
MPMTGTRALCRVADLSLPDALVRCSDPLPFASGNFAMLGQDVVLYPGFPEHRLAGRRNRRIAAAGAQHFDAISDHPRQRRSDLVILIERKCGDSANAERYFIVMQQLDFHCF